MTQILRKNSTDTISVGPFVNTSTGQPITTATLVSADTAVAILFSGTNTDISGLTFAADGSADGLYDLTLTAAVTSTVGPLSLFFADVDRFLPLRLTYQVLTSTSYDAIYASAPTLLTAKDVGQMFESTVGTVTSQTQFIVDDTINTSDNWNGLAVVIENVTNGDTNVRRITDVDQATDTIVIDSAPTFTVEVGDIIRVESQVHPETTNFTAIKTATDQLTFSVSGQVDANVQSINDAAVTGSGTTADPWT